MMLFAFFFNILRKYVRQCLYRVSDLEIIIKSISDKFLFFKIRNFTFIKIIKKYFLFYFGSKEL